MPRRRGKRARSRFQRLALREQDDARSCEWSPRLVRASRFLLAGCVLAAGLIAALPFRQAAHPLPAPSLVVAPIELTLRRPDLPLQLAARSDVSPAVGLEAMAGPPAPTSARGLTSLRS